MRHRRIRMWGRKEDISHWVNRWSLTLWYTCIYRRGRQKNKTPHRCFSTYCCASVERRNHQELNPYEKRYRWTQHRNEKLRRCNKFLEHIISLTCCIFFPRSSSHCRDSNVVLHIHEKHIGKSVRHKCDAFIMC